MIFTLCEKNIAFLKNPVEKYKERIGDAPYWSIHGRICYHNHEEPTYIIHNFIPVEAIDAKDWYLDYVHVYPNKKTLYTMSHYSLSELKELAQQLEVSLEGKKKDIYERIQNKFKPFLSSMLNAM